MDPNHERCYSSSETAQRCDQYIEEGHYSSIMHDDMAFM